MTWFYCSLCCDTVKKPKVAAHSRCCRGASFTCIDCSYTFDSRSVQGHTTCVTEKEKYVDGVTKASGYQYVNKPGEHCKGDVHILGREHLSAHPPWRCTLCNVSCTSESTMLAHAAGQKHRRRSRAFEAGLCDRTELDKRPASLVLNSSPNSQGAGQDPAQQPDQDSVEAEPTATVSVRAYKLDVEEGSQTQNRNGKQQCQLETLALVSPIAEKNCTSDDLKDCHATQLEVQIKSSENREPLTPVVKKLVKKHGGRMELSSLIGAISKKKKKRLGLTGTISTSQIVEALFKDGEGNFDIMIVQRDQD